MSSLNFAIMPIKDLVDLFKHLFGRGEFAVVQNILEYREMSLKAELEGIKTQWRVSDQCKALKKKQSLDEAERSSLLVRSESQRGELCAKIAKLTEEGRVLSERLKCAEERCVNVCNEQCEMLRTRDEMIIELNGKIARLTEEGRVLSERMKCAEERCVKMCNEQCEVSRTRDETIFALNKNIGDLEKYNTRLTEESEENITRLTEEVRMSNERLKRMEERYAKVCKEEKVTLREKKDAIVEMSRRLGEVKKEVWEKCRSLERFREKLRSCDVKVAIMKNEIVELGREKSLADRAIERMRREKLEVDREMEVLRRGILVSNDNAQTENNVIGLEKESGKDLDFDGKLMAKFPPLVTCSTAYEISGNTNKDLPRTVSCTKEVVPNGDTCESSHQSGERSDYVSPQAENENNGVVQQKGSQILQGSADHNGIVWSDDETSGANLGEKEKSREKSLSSSPTFDQSSSHLKRKRSSSLDDNVQIHQQREKRTRISTSDRDESNGNEFSNQKIDGGGQETMPSPSNRVMIRGCEEKGRAAVHSETNLPNFFDLPSDGESSTDSNWDSSDSDDSCSSSCIKDSLASIQSPKYCRTWMFGVDMLKDFVKDVELCMNAVCVLYRRQQQITSGSASSEGLCHFNAMGGRALAEYLIDGDPEMRLRKTINEVKAQRLEALDQCTRLAKDYYAPLFSIYCSGEDHFFKS